MFLANSKKQTGQVLLVVVLVMVVVLTLGLSIASKSITSFKTSTEEADSQKALNAAEAGIERIIAKPIARLSGVFENSSYLTTVKDTNLNKLLLNAGNPIAKDEGIDLWLSKYPDYAQPDSPITQFRIYWGTKDNVCDNPAIEIALIYNTPSDPKLTKYAFDPCESRGNNFVFDQINNGTFLSSGVSFRHYVTIDVTNGNGLIARIVPLYKDGIIGVLAGSGTAFPSQGKIISSTGTSGNNQRKLTVFQGHPSVPGEFFPYNLFQR
jgi:hypothetical protein